MVAGLHHCDICLVRTQIWFQSKVWASQEGIHFTPLHWGPTAPTLPDMFYKGSVTSIFRAERKQVKSVSVNIGSDFTCTNPLHFGGKKIIVLSYSDTCTQLFSAATSSTCISVEDLRWTHSHTNQSFSAATFSVVWHFLAHRSAARLYHVDEWRNLCMCVMRYETGRYSLWYCNELLANGLVVVLCIPPHVWSLWALSMYLPC